MEISITDISEVEKKITVQASATELVPHFEKAYRKQVPKIEIKGFRKGKAPLDLIKKLYGESIEYNSLDTVASDVYREVIQGRDIHPIGDPVLTDIDYKRGEALTFTIKYEVKPKIELSEYKGIAVQRMVHHVSDTETDDEILRLRRANCTMTPVETATDDEHIVTADIQQLDESSSPLIGKKTVDARLYLADESVYQEIRSSLRNATVGMTPRVTVTLEDNGKQQKDFVEITVKKIEKVILPEFNDEFVKKITKDKVPTVEEFRKQLHDDIDSYWRDRSERKLVDELIGEIVRRHDFMVPESISNSVLESLLEELKNRSPQKKYPDNFNEKDFREKNRGYSVFQAKWFLIRERILEAEKIETTDADLEELAEKDAPKVGIDKARLLTFYKSSSAVSDRILSDKLMKFLKEQSRITEKVTDESFG